MKITNKNVSEIIAIILILVFGVLVFFAVEPLIFSILWGLIFAYVFLPVYRKILPFVKNKSLAASIVMLIAILIILIPLWFIIPLIIGQVFELFRSSQTLNIAGFLGSLSPTASEQFLVQATAALSSVISKLSAAIMGWLVNFLVDMPYLILNIIVVLFVFFFALRDSDKLVHFVKSASPLQPSNEKMIVKSFKDITFSVIYGNFIVGVIQGLLAGLGFWVFGIDNALVLAILATFFSILPFAGSFLIWIPIAIYLFVVGNTAIAITFVLYNAIVVSNIDNVLRAYILSSRTNLSPLFAFISSVGGLLLFGIIGLILGPLIFAYFLIIIDMYKKKNLLSLFSSKSNNHKIK